MKELTYHNSFIICDSQEAYILETAKKLWAAEKITGKIKADYTMYQTMISSNKKIKNCRRIQEHF